MLNKSLHKEIMINVLRSIYSNRKINTVLGFKGGTAAFLFYELPRFSVDLDFDLLDEAKKEIVLENLKKILNKFGTLIEATEKHYTFFCLLSYRKGERGLKIEVSKRTGKSSYGLRNYLGIPMLVMKEEDVIANKLAALLTRKRFASRDLFDMWFFLKKGWKINEEALKEKTGLATDKAIEMAIKNVESLGEYKLLQGLGELLQDQKQKDWIKRKLREEVLFLLKLYKSNLKP